MIGAMLPTPFHVRTAEHNCANAWTALHAFTVPAHYGDPHQESLAPRLTAALFDISAHEDLRIQGAGAAALLSAACAAPLGGLSPGQSQDVHWCADGDGLRGTGLVSRLGKDDFLLRSEDADIGWFAGAAPRFEAAVRDITCERGLLFLSGPFAQAILEAAGLQVSHLAIHRHADHDWRGLAVTVLRKPRPRGYELACAADDATLLFDRLMRAGRMFGLRLAGEDALRLLRLEEGLPRAHADFTPAREPFAREPAPASLGVEDARGAAGMGDHSVLAGIQMDGAEPAPFAPVFCGGSAAGRALGSAYSPALRSAIALAQLSASCAAPGTRVTIRRLDAAGPQELRGMVVSLPFLG
jgi:aminomethyltransferase